MADEWHAATVSELQRDGVLLVEDGNHGEYRPRPDEFVTAGVAFIRAADMDAGRVQFESASRINDRASARITKGIGAAGDILLSHKGTVGKVALVADDAPPFVCSPQTTFWRTLDINRLDRNYLFAFLRSPEFHAQLATRAGETDMAPYVSLTSQRGLFVTLPPLNVQRAIAHILGTLDDKIELNRRMNETLDAMARALFKSWFVDFDPVSAKIEGRNPGICADLFSRTFEDSELGRIPSGWRTGTLHEVASVFMGLSPDGDSYNAIGLGTPLINGPVEFGEYFPVKSKWTTSPGRMAEAGDLIFCVRGSTTGRRVVADDAYCLGRGVCALRPIGVSRAFLYQLVEANLDRLLSKTTGSVFPSLSAPDIKEFSVVVPSHQVLAAFGRFAQPLTERIEANIVMSVTLAALRDTLLPKLISGELRVKTAEKIVEAVA